MAPRKLKAAYNYDTDAGYLLTTFRISSTVIPLVLRRTTFWILFMLHLSLHYAFRNDWLDLQTADEGSSDLFLDWKEAQIVAALTTFLEVFYTNECFSRYWYLHTVSREMIGTLFDVQFMSRLHTADAHLKHIRCVSRWLVAALCLWMFELKKHSEQEFVGVSDREWDYLVAHGLIRPEERKFLEGYKDQFPADTLLVWTAQVARDGLHRAGAPCNARKGVTDKLVSARYMMQEVADILDLPIPFQYFHLVNMLVVINMLMLAYGMAMTRSFVTPIVYFFAAIIYLGMIELAGQLSNPFGSDALDFPVQDWLTEFIENRTMLAVLDLPSLANGFQDILPTEKPLRRGKWDFKMIRRVG